MSTQDVRSRRSTLLQRYQPGVGSQDPIQQPQDSAPITRSTSQRSLQNSSLLQKYYQKTTSQDLRTDPPTQPDSASSQPKRSSSQRSLDQSKLLQRYYKQNSVDSQDVPKPDPQQYSSQKNLDNSKLLQRYNVNNSQEFTGLAARESTPVARFQRSGSLDHDRMTRSSLLSKYTPRFGKSLDRNKAAPISTYSNYSSQQSLEQQDPVQSVSASQTIADYGGDHFDQYDARNLRSRSSSMARGLNRKSLQRDLPPHGRNLEMEKENIPLDPVTPETLPVVATSVPVMGNIASALPMPMLSAVTPTPMLEVSAPAQEPPPEITPPPKPMQPVVSNPQPELPKRIEPVKPPRKDLAPATTVSIPIPNIKTTITVEPPTPVIPTKKEAPVVLKDPSPPMFSSRDRMEHYGGAPISPSSPPSKPPPKQQSKSPARTMPSAKDTLLLPITDFSSRRSMTDLRQAEEETNSFAMEIDEFSDRHELSNFSKKRDSIKSTLASAFEQIAVLSVPHARDALEDEGENIESLPPNRKLKKRDHTYHPSFVPKQAKLEENERKKQEEKAKQEIHKKEVERKKEEEKLRKEEEKLKKENEKHKKEEEKRRKEDEKKMKAEEDKHRKEDEKKAKVEEEKHRKEAERLAKEEEKRLKEEEKRLREEEKRKRDEEKKKQKEEKKLAAMQKASSTEQKEPEQPEEDTIVFGNHLEQYSVSAPAKQQNILVGRPRSSGTPHGSQAALNRHTLPAMSTPMYSSQHSLDRTDGVQSKMLQRYAKRSGSQDYTHSAEAEEVRKFIKDVHTSQGSLDHQRAATRSSLLQKYTPKPLGASTTAGSPAVIPPSSTPKSTSQVSLDKTRIEKSSLLQRYKPRSESADGRPGELSGLADMEPRKSAIVFTPKRIPDKASPFDYRDHEYEPIGEPVDDKIAEAKPSAAKDILAPPTDDQKRKLSSSSLRVPGEDGDTISMAELQKDIEDRYFNRPSVERTTMDVSEPVEAAAQEKTSKVKSAMVRAQESGKKAMARAQEGSRNAMAKAQEGSKSLHQKLRKQTDKFKIKMTKKDKDVAPLASPEIVTTPEIEKLDFTLAEPMPEQETGEIEPAPVSAEEAPAEAETEDVAAENGTSKKKFKGADFSKIKNIHMPKIQKPEFKRPEFTKISKPKMPKLKAPDMSKFKRPEMPKFLTEKPDFSKLKMPEKIGTIKIQRSKSMKEPVLSSATSAVSPSEIETPSAIDGDGTKKKVNYTDFSTYPRLLDKFKRQKSVPSNASVRASTPPPLEFTKAGKTSRAKGTGLVSRWAEKSSEDAGSTRFFTGSELGEREGSVEKRMRQRLERADFDEPELAVTAEQKQLEEYDKENREIHQLSAARHDEFMKRKPPMERQESDLASEEEKQFWASSLGQKIRQNIDMNSNDFDFLDEEDRLRTAREAEMGLSAQDRARFLGESLGEHSEKDYDLRSTTPYSNKECQSSGSSGIRRRKGVIEEIDDDEFFLRQKGISKDNIQMGEYISSAIKEGLSTPKNALAEMGRYDDAYYDDEADASERMSMEYRAEHGAGGRYYQPSFESDDVSNKQSFTDEFRKQADFFKTFPPDRPIRKHKKSYNDDHFDDDHQKVPYDSYQQEEEHDVEFYGRDRKYGSVQPEIRTEREESYMDEESVGNGFTLTGTAVPPTPPRRRKKRFRDVTPSELTPFGNGLTSKPIYNSFTLGPETHIFNADVPLAQEESFTTPLPTPRRSRSRSQISKLMDDDRTSRGAESYIFGAEDNALVKLTIDMSESNGYATVRKEPPPRPPAPIRRRKSTRSLGDQRQFNTLPNFHSVSPARPSRNYSTINPNRPPRGRSISSLNESATKLPSISKDDITQYEEIEAVENQTKLHETLQSGEVVKKMKDRPLPPPPRPPRDTRKPRRFDHDDRHDFDGGAERITSFDTIEPRVIEEVEIAIQTDPVSEDFELDIEVSEAMSNGEQAGKSGKTLQEILKEEQQAEIDRARQLAEASNLMRDIQKFRDSTSSLSLHGSRPETPSAMSFERRVSAPSTSQMVPGLSSENLTEQDLANIDDDKFIAELVKKYVSEEKVTDNSKKPQKAAEEPRAPVERIEPEKLREIESMIVQESVQREDIRAVQSGPSAPPRRRSLVSSTQDIPTSIEIPQNVIEEIVERLRTNEQQHIAELEQFHHQQLEDLRKQQEEQRLLQEQKMEEQQKVLLEQQNQQLHETQLLKEQILQQQEQQMALLQQQQQQQQQLLLAQQQQQLLLQQQEKERELQRERERELLREREIELEKARERERELHHARELELQRARDLEQQRARELEQQRLRELELQRTMELEHQRLRELELQRAQEVEMQRAREMELQLARDAELQRARDMEIQRIRESEMLRTQEAELLKLKDMQRKMRESQVRETRTSESAAAHVAAEVTDSVEAMLRTQEAELLKLSEIERKMRESQDAADVAAEDKVEVADSMTLESEVVAAEGETAVSEKKPAVEPVPVRPPPPRISPQMPISAQFPYQEYLPYSLPQQPIYPTRNLSDEEGAYPQAPHRRRRHHRSRRESTSEEDFQREQRKQRHGTRSPEPSIPALGSQLIRACGSSIRETGDELMTILRASSKDENKRDLHIALIILIVIVAGLMALGMSGEQSVHHHHWDYFNPPGTSGH